MSDRILLSDAFLEHMAAQGLIPPECERVTIELTPGKIIKITYDCNGTDALLADISDVLRVKIR